MCKSGGTVVKNLPANAGDTEDEGSILGWEDPWSRKWQPTPTFLPGKFHGQRRLAGYSPWGCKESDMTEHVRIPLNKQGQTLIVLPACRTLKTLIASKVKEI